MKVNKNLPKYKSFQKKNIHHAFHSKRHTRTFLKDEFIQKCKFGDSLLTPTLMESLVKINSP